MPGTNAVSDESQADVGHDINRVWIDVAVRADGRKELRGSSIEHRKSSLRSEVQECRLFLYARWRLSHRLL